MANLVEITVKTNDDATKDLSKIKSAYSDAGTASGKGFSSNFDKSIGSGLTGRIFGKSGGSDMADAQKAGQDVGMGLGRGMLQKFQTTLGSGLLSGLFGTSGGTKLFGSAGNTVISDAAKQGNNIAQGFAKGLNDGFGSVGGQLTGLMSNLFGGGGDQRTVSDAEGAGKDTASGFASGLRSGLSSVSSELGGILSGLFGGSGAGPDLKAGEDSGADAGKGFLDGFGKALSSGSIGSILSKALGSAGSGSSGGGLAKLLAGGSSGDSGDGGGLDAAKSALNSGGVAGGALPGVAGISGFAATITGLAGVLVAVLPAITSVVSGLGVLGAGFMILDKTNKAFAADVTSTMGTIEGVFKSAVQPLAQPMEQAMSQISGYLKSLEPEFKAVFSDAAPLLAPLVKGFEQMTSGILPGFLAMIKAAGPVFTTLSGAFADLGTSLGSMFKDFAAAEGPSAVVLKAVLDLVNTLFPILGKLGEVFASAIAPAVAAFGSALDKVLPALLPLASIIAQLAGAALTDLASILTAVGNLLVGIAPSFTLLAKAAGQVFTAMENDGVFASIGNAIEGLSTPLSNLINALVKGLVPVLPQIVSLFSSMASALTGGLVTILSGVANGFASLIKAVPPGVIQAIGDAFVAWKVLSVVDGALGGLVDVAVKGITPLLNLAKSMGLVDTAMDANPIGLVVIAVAALAAGFYIAWEKSSTFRDIVKDIGVVALGMAKTVVEGAQIVTNAFLTMAGDVLHAAATAFGWVPGIGPKLKEASAAFDGMKTDVNNAFDAMTGKISNWQKALQNGQTASHTAAAGIAGDFQKQQQAADKATTSLNNYTTAIKNDGTDSDQAKSARQQLIADLVDAGVKAGTAQKDIDNYTTAVKENGVYSDQAKAARQQLANDILQCSKNATNGKSDMDTYTTAVRNNGADSDAAKAARQQLIKDLENAGLSAKQAGDKVTTFTKLVESIPKGWDVKIDLSGSGSWSVGEASIPHPKAAGGLIPGSGNADDYLALLTPGETVVPKALTPRLAPLFRSLGLPGFGGGGYVGSPPGLGSWAYGDWKTNVASMVSATELAMWQAVEADIAAAQKASAAGGAGAGSPGGSGAVNAALARKMYPAWATGLNWTDWNNVAMRESGWSTTAQNPSGALGIAQALGHGVSGGGGTLGNEYGGYGLSLAGDRAANSGNAGSQITWMHNYIADTYGGPPGAWNSELTRGYYAAGGPASGWISVGEHGRELIKVPNGSTVIPHGASQQITGMVPGGGGVVQLQVVPGGDSEFEQFMLTALRKWVRVKGGGSVQSAFGRS